MTTLEGCTVESCGCTTGPDGRAVSMCPECLKAALAERTHGIPVAAFLEGHTHQYRSLWQRFRAWLASL